MDSKPSRPVKEGVSLLKSMASSELALHQFSSAPLPVHCTLSYPASASFATSRELRLLPALPHQQHLQHRRFFSTFNFFSHLVTLLVNLLCINGMFSSTFSVKTAISEALKFCFRALPEIAGDANCGLNALNPRLANLSSNCALNNAILTAT